MTTPLTYGGRFVRTPVSVVQHLHRQREGQDAVVGGHLIISTLQRALCAGTIVAANVDDQRVVELALVLNLLNHAANLIIGIGRVGGEDLGLARV